jgi:type IV pilus assembly protein PilO
MKVVRGRLVTQLNLYIAAVAVLVIVNLVLLTQLLLAWHTLRADRPEEIQQQQALLRTTELQTLPLRELPAKVQTSAKDADHFYAARVPGNYSSISAELGSLAQKYSVRLARVQYVQAPAIHDLAEVRMDAGLSGDYTPMMRFINSLERDKMFFVIRGLTLTGQQGGIVNLRLQLATYLHGENLDRMAPPVGGSENTQGTDANTGAQ